MALRHVVGQFGLQWSVSDAVRPSKEHACEVGLATIRLGCGDLSCGRCVDSIRGHSLADPDELRAEAEKEFWAQRDPIKRLAAHLIEHNLATAEELKGIEKEIDAEVADCVEFALAAPEPKPEELTRYIWAED